ncbi:VanW family protein [Nitriliruptor alkaliphilus]|uniref:VanW family protein n=1 Tax=Nitriliruptor alkaliphilus TaxID=427918 RepID=UPI000696A05F|nr:VanW family protein [Nitriliruptor alkaliphilus]
MAESPLLERPAARWVVLAVGAILLVLAAAYILLVGLQRGQGETVLTGVHVDGESVGGASRAELVATVDARTEARLADPVVVVASEGELETDRAGVGASVDREATIDAAWERGRRGFLRALRDHARARMGGTVDVGIEVTADRRELARWATDAADQLSQPVRDAAVELVARDGEDDTVDVAVTDPREGREVDPGPLAQEVAGRVERPGEVRVEVPARTRTPDITDVDLEAVVPRAELAVSASVTLTNPSAGEDLVLAPGDLASVLVVLARPEEPEGARLAVHTDGDRLADHLGDEGIGALEEPPVEADFEVTGDTVEIVGGTPGFAVDVDRTAFRVLELATRDDDRAGELAGDTTEPELSRQDAEELGIEQVVSSFSTPLTPGEARNHNIHLGADLFDGSIIHPGDRFSLNEAIGPRTRERGFVENGFIDADGELISVVGGGSSQLGTTFLNAAWFAGIAIVEFQPHSYYFERYPMGREATLSFGHIDVVVENDSPHAILVVTSHSESEVTVRFVSSPWAEVDTWTDDPRDRVPGQERDGFTVEYGRTITYPDGSTEEESYVHRYEPED